MPTVVVDCPHPSCRAKKAGFNIINQTQSPNKITEWSLYCQCGACKKTIVVICEQNPGLGVTNPPMQSDNFQSTRSSYYVRETYPHPPAEKSIEDLPTNVASSFSEAEKSFAENIPSAAAAMYRKAIERSVKSLDPSSNGMLHARIRALEKKGSSPIP